MPTSEAGTTVSAETAAGSTTTDAFTYQSIIDSANGILIGFVERIPYFVASIIVILIFWFLSTVFKKIVFKILGSRSRHQNLVKVFQRVGGALIIFIGFMIAMVIAVPGFTPAKLIGALGIGSVAIGFAFKDIFQNLLSGILLLISEPFVSVIRSFQVIMKALLRISKSVRRPSRLMMVGRWSFRTRISILRH